MAEHSSGKGYQSPHVKIQQQPSLSLLPSFILTPTAARCLGRKGKGESRPAGRLGRRAEAKPHSQPTAMHLDGGGDLPCPAAFPGTVNTRQRGARAPKAALLSSRSTAWGKVHSGHRACSHKWRKGQAVTTALPYQHSQPANLDTLSKSFSLSKACLSASQSAPWTHWIQAPTLIM